MSFFRSSKKLKKLECNYEDCMPVHYFKLTNPLEKAEKDCKEAEGERGREEKNLETAKREHKEATASEKRLSEEIQQDKVNKQKLVNALEDVEIALEANEDKLKDVVGHKGGLEEEISAHTEALRKVNEVCNLRSEQYDIVKSVVEEEDYSKRPLGFARVGGEKEYRKALNVIQAVDISDMKTAQLEETFRFLKVLGVVQATANRSEGLSNMKVALMKLLFPELFPSDEIESPNTKNQRIADRLLAEKQEEDQMREMERIAAKEKAVRAKADAQNMLASLMTPKRSTTHTPHTNKKRKAGSTTPEEPPQELSPAEAAFNVCKNLDAAVLAEIRRACSTPFVDNDVVEGGDDETANHDEGDEAEAYSTHPATIDIVEYQRDRSSFSAALAREKQRRVQRQERGKTRVEEHQQKEEAKQQQMIEMLGLQGLKPGQKITIAPRKDG